MTMMSTGMMLTMMTTRVTRMGKPWRRSTCEKSGMLITSERTCKSHLLNKLENHISLLTSKKFKSMTLVMVMLKFVWVASFYVWLCSCTENGFGKKMWLKIWFWHGRRRLTLDNIAKFLRCFWRKLDWCWWKGEDESDNGRPPLLVTRAKPKLSLMLSRTQWLAVCYMPHPRTMFTVHKQCICTVRGVQYGAAL